MVAVQAKVARGVSALALCATLIAAGCGGERSATATEVLVELDSQPFGPPTSLVMRRDGGWTARCSHPAERRTSGQLDPAELAGWRSRVASVGTHVVVRQRPRRDDATLTVVVADGRRIETDASLEDLAMDLWRFANRSCGRAPEDRSPVITADRPLRVGEARRLSTDEAVGVRGHVFVEDGRARMCALILESLPPQCGGAWLAVEDVERARLDSQRLRGVAWTGTVTLSGRLEDGVLTVEP